MIDVEFAVSLPGTSDVLHHVRHQSV